MKLLAEFAELLARHEPAILHWTGVISLIVIPIWFFTGYLRFVGWLVRLWWLQINALFCPVWWFFAVLGYIYLRYSKLFWVLGGSLVVFVVMVTPQGREATGLVVAIMVGVLLLWLGTINRYFFRRMVSFYPTALRTPAPFLRIPTPSTDKPSGGGWFTRKPPAEAQTPLVRIKAAYSGGHDNEAKIVGKLPPHLQNLLAGRFEKS